MWLGILDGNLSKALNLNCTPQSLHHECIELGIVTFVLGRTFYIRCLFHDQYMFRLLLKGSILLNLFVCLKTLFVLPCHITRLLEGCMCLDPLDAMTLWAFKTWTITMYYPVKSDMFNLLTALSCVENVARS